MMEQSEATIKSHNLVYFHKAAIGFKPKINTESKPLDIELIIPKRNKKLFDTYKPEFLNWDYTCKCGQVV